MFTDPFTPLMVLVILGFTGTLLMFMFGLCTIDGTQKTLNDIKAQMAVDAADLDQRLRDIEAALRRLESARVSGVSPGVSKVPNIPNVTGSIAVSPIPATPVTPPASVIASTPWSPDQPLSLK